MDELKQIFRQKSTDLKDKIKTVLKEHGNMKLDEVKLEQAFGGMRGIKSMIWETSLLDAQDGIKFRGYSIPQIQELLPKAPNGSEPLPEGVFWLMLTGEIPTQSQVNWLSDEWERRSTIPDTMYKVLDALPVSVHPMTQFSIAINALQVDSVFFKNYEDGMSKNDYWDSTYEDAMNLIARIPAAAAYIYRRTFKENKHIPADSSLDWAANFAHMLGLNSDECYDFMRLYQTIHADHEGGNASAHTAHLVGSTLSDVYLSYAAGINALAGPLHGLANQEVIKWIFELTASLNTTKPTNEQVASYIQDTLKNGKVIPGYGHAVLRKPDPRYYAQMKFSQRYLADDDIVKIVWQLFEIVPPILQNLGKVSNPWPNVDAHSGAILVHYGINEYNFYTVLFGVSRSLGVMAAQCWSRALGFPLERPKSLTSEWIFDFVLTNKQ
ncbi:MAG: citrate (Si)-synthase [Saprospiraceae bacterium]